MSDILLEMLAGEAMSVYVGRGIKERRAYVYERADNEGIKEDEYVTVSIERKAKAGRLKDLHDLFKGLDVPESETK